MTDPRGSQGQQHAFHETPALAALDKATALGGKEDATSWFLMAMIHGQKGEKEQTRPWFDKAVAWMKARSYQGMDPRLLWTEAAARFDFGWVGIGFTSSLGSPMSLTFQPDSFCQRVVTVLT
jgi:hypothetical protein